MAQTTTLEFRWTVSRARDTYGYNICTLYVNGGRVTSCNGGGYDMQGTVLGLWVAKAFADRLVRLTPAKMEKRDGKPCFYGLTFHDPDYDPGKAVGKGGKTVEQMETEGSSLGLARYQARYAASSAVPTKRHTAPFIDGACGFSSVERIAKAIGLTMQYIPTRSKSLTIYTLEDAMEGQNDRR